MNAPGLEGAHLSGEPQQEIFQWLVEPFLERRLNLTLKMYRFGKIRRYIEDGLNLTPRLIQHGENHPQCF